MDDMEFIIEETLEKYFNKPLDEKECVKILRKEVANGAAKKLHVRETINSAYETVFEEYPQCELILRRWKHCCYPMKKEDISPFTTSIRDLSKNKFSLMDKNEIPAFEGRKSVL